MYQAFHTMEELFAELRSDKESRAAGSVLRDRYPFRFVLLETFGDFRRFVAECVEHGVQELSLAAFLPAGKADRLPTYTQLLRRIQTEVGRSPAWDYYIAPFSEVARFYACEPSDEFGALVKGLRLTEARAEAQGGRQRIYVPVIGMQGKMWRFKDDPNIWMWEYCGAETAAGYRLLLTPGTLFGLNGLGRGMTVCRDVREWVTLWKGSQPVARSVVCASRAIYAAAANAQPDNAFDYVTCATAYDMLTLGLGFDFGPLRPTPHDAEHWQRLASEIDIRDFSFEAYVAERFNVQNVCEPRRFVEAWHDATDGYARWLLRAYYIYKHGATTYLGRVLTAMEQLSWAELLSLLATLIFTDGGADDHIAQRRRALVEASRHGATLTEQDAQMIKARLSALAASPQAGARRALPFVVPLTDGERSLMIDWLGKGAVSRDDLRPYYPDIFTYTAPAALGAEPWLDNYFTEYVASKIAGRATAALSASLAAHNGSPAAFEGWHAALPTVRTLLSSREDIDVVYWIDGLGVDWLSLVMAIIAEHRSDGVFLNELHVARAVLPTRTAENRAVLESLAPGRLTKIGDLDAFAHSHKAWPSALATEIALVRRAVEEVLAKYNGQKIALVSDHGLTYLSQYGGAMSLAGAGGDHGGRVATWAEGAAPSDNRWLSLPDGRTLCSLTHASLTAKTPAGQGAHGGATPEEALVPVLIISGQRNATAYSARLLTPALRPAAPAARYALRGLTGAERPEVEYNGTRYRLRRLGGEQWESEPLPLVETAQTLRLLIGDFSQRDKVSVVVGVVEDDLFA